MFAVALVEKNSRYALKLQELEYRPPQNGEALVRVKYCGVNHLDVLILNKLRVGPKSFPHILGSEIVGRVEEIKSENFNFKKGDLVVVYPWIFCGECKQCKEGRENICDNGGTIGRTTWGGFAEFITVPLKNLIPVPKSVNLISVCALTLAGTTAMHLVNRLKVKNGSNVLVTGATGGVGTVVIQLLKRLRCKIIAITSSKSKQADLLKLGVDKVMPLKKFPDSLLKLYPQGVEFAIDIVGGSIWSKTVEALAKNSTMTFCATTLDDLGIINIGSAFSRQINILGSYGGTIQDLREVINLMKVGKLQPVINSIYKLKDLKTALAKLERKKVFGKIIIEI